MPTVTPLKFNAPEYLARLYDDDSRTRNRVHLGQIINHILVAQGKVKPHSGAPDEHVLGHWEKGFLWEELASLAMAARLGHREYPVIDQAEVEYDGVCMTPDRVVRSRVREYKATWKSSRHEITGPEFRHWFWQLAGYCLAHGTTRGELWVFFMMGDYRGSGPQIRRWKVDFTKADLAQVWAMIRANRRAVERRLNLNRSK